MNSSLHPWRETKKQTKRNETKEERRKKNKKEKNPKPNNPRAHASISNGRGCFFFFLWFLTEGKGESGLAVCTGRTRHSRLGGTPGVPSLWSLWRGERSSPGGPRRGTQIVFRLRGARGEPPSPATQHKIKQKGCFLGLCGLFFVLVSRF